MIKITTDHSAFKTFLWATKKGQSKITTGVKPSILPSSSEMKPLLQVWPLSSWLEPSSLQVWL